jgi:hypothetical protein
MSRTTGMMGKKQNIYQGNRMVYIITEARYSVYVQKQENKERCNIKDFNNREKH